MTFIYHPEVLFAQSKIVLSCGLSFHGHIIDGETNKGIVGAIIQLKSENKSTISGAKGLFQFDNLCNQNLVITCEHLGYKPLNLQIQVSPQMDLNIKLHADTCTLESVVITAYKKNDSPMPTAQLKGIELDKTRGLSLGESLQKIAGVYSLQTGPSIFKPVIQGMYGQRVLILNNGVRQEGQQWGSEHAPEIDPFVATKLTVVKGAQTVRYGSDALGGVVLVEPADMRKSPGISGDLNIASFSNNRQGTVSGIINFVPNGKLVNFSTRLQGTLKQAGNAQTPNYWLDNTGFTEKNFSWAMAYNLPKKGLEIFYSQFNTRIGIFTGSHFGDTSDLAAAIRRKTPNVPSKFTYDIGRPYQEVSHELFKIKSYWLIGNKTKLEGDFARQFNYRAEFDTDRPFNNSLRNLPEMKFGLTTHTSNLVIGIQNHPHFRSSFGLFGMRQANTVRSTLGSFFIPNYFVYAAGAFAIGNFNKNAWEAELGIRYDYRFLEAFIFRPISAGSFDYRLERPRLLFQNPSASLAVSWSFNNQFKIKWNIATAFRAPTGNELYSNGVHHGVNAFERGDSTLNKEVSYNNNLGFIYQNKKTLLDLSFYHNYVDDYIFLQPMAGSYIVSIRGATPLFEYKQVDASFLGLDANFQDSLFSNLVINSKLSVLRATNISNQEGLVMTPPARLTNTITFCKFGGILHTLNPFFSINHIYTAQKQYLPPNSDFKAAPNSYHLFGIELGIEKKYTRSKIQLAFTVSNIFDQVYRDYLDRFRYFNDAIGRNSMLRMKISFI